MWTSEYTDPSLGSSTREPFRKLLDLLGSEFSHIWNEGNQRICVVPYSLNFPNLWLVMGGTKKEWLLLLFKSMRWYHFSSCNIYTPTLGVYTGKSIKYNKIASLLDSKNVFIAFLLPKYINSGLNWLIHYYYSLSKYVWRLHYMPGFVQVADDKLWAHPNS